MPLIHNTVLSAPQIDAFEDGEREERYASALTFLRGLFEPTDTICIWLINQQTKEQKPFFPTFEQATDTQTFQQLDEYQEKNWDVYVCMNSLQSGATRRKKENIAEIRTAYLDLDDNGPAKLDEVNKAVEAGEVPAPRFIVSSSPKKYHVSWRLNGATQQQQEELLDKLIARFGGDKAASDCVRVLRLPGFTNLKYETKPTVLILKQSDSVATLDQFKIVGAPTEQEFEAIDCTTDGPKIPHGQHDSTLTKICGKIHREQSELSVSELKERLIEICEYRCENYGSDYREMCEKIANSIGSKVDKPELLWNGKEHQERTAPQEVAQTAATAQASGLKFNFPAVTGGIFDFVVEPLGFSSEGWFPLGSPSLVGGKSGSAKSTWMLDLLLKQAKKEPFLSHNTCGRPFLVLMADRGEDSHKRTMHRMGMANENIPIKFFTPKIGLPMWQEIIDKIEEASIPQVVFIEGADFLVEDGNKKQYVTPFMTALQKIAEHYHIAIIGSVGAPKTKMGEGYTAKRDSISGSEAWSRLAETVVTLQYPDGEDTSDCREVSVLLRNGPSESFSMKFRDGRLVPLTEEERKRAENKDPVLDWVQLQSALSQSDPAKQWWTRQDMRKQLGLAKSTAGDWIADAHSKGWIVMKPGEKTKGNGKANEYQWNTSETNPKHRPELSVRSINSSEVISPTGAKSPAG